MLIAEGKAVQYVGKKHIRNKYRCECLLGRGCYLNHATENASDLEALDQAVAGTSNTNNDETSNEPITKIGWSTKQNSIVSNYFSGCIRRKWAPKKGQCHQFQKEYSDLFGNREWKHIKALVCNLYKDK